jgi:CubicO group peptidase (beta-lactamase class C family)
MAHNRQPPRAARSSLIVAWCLGLALGVIGPAGCRNPARFDTATLDRFFDVLESNDRMMGSVTVRQHGEVIYRRTLGRRFDGPTGAERTDSETKFRIGSITKVFTAVMIYQLIDEGKLALDTKLSRFFPRVANAEGITIAHLLGHTTGLPNYASGWKSDVVPTRETMVSRIEQLQGRFAPGAKREYSNTNFTLLGFIVEDVSGQDYGRALDERIVKRIGLHRTHFGGEVHPGNNEARAFYFDEGKWTMQPDDDIRLAGGAGGIVSTTDDLTEFVTAVFAGRLIGAASLRELTTPFAEGIGSGGKGIGPYTLATPEKHGFAHDGGIGAFGSLVGYMPEDGIAVAITINGYNYPQNRVFRSIWQILYGSPIELPSFTRVPLPDDAQRRYAGRYALGESLSIDVRVESTGLVAQASGQDAFPLTAIGPRSFVYVPAGILVEFEDATVPSTKFTLFQQKGELVLERE